MQGMPETVPWIEPERVGANGLAGYGGNLRPAMLLRAYREGVFPWFNPGDPILWWSPDPRAIIELGQLHISRSLARTLRQGRFQTTINACFGEVIRACAKRHDSDGTWITTEIIAAYEALHRQGDAHSVESWVRTPNTTVASESPPGPGWTLAGGIYGVAVGGLFAGESMFYRVTDGSKVALVKLESHLRERGYALFDVQMTTSHTETMGAYDIPRSEYLQRLRAAIPLPVRFIDPPIRLA
jgi:leucyl/phenylalanyl-tRNA--protein transferase